MQKQLNAEDIQRIELNILKYFHDLCERNNLRYYLAYGSLIGAIRHKGFIPWDDDIDVLMPFEDYKKLINLFSDSSESRYRFISREIDKDYYLPYGKVIDTNTVMKEEINTHVEIGVYMDVFPLYNLSDDFQDALKKVKKAYNYCRIINIKNIKLSKKRKWYKNAALLFAKLIVSICERNGIAERIEKLACKNKTQYIGAITDVSNRNDECGVFEAKWFDQRKRVYFEDVTLWAPAGYDEFLRHFYGNYMQIPPQDQQCSHHSFEAWERNRG